MLHPVILFLSFLILFSVSQNALSASDEPRQLLCGGRIVLVAKRRISFDTTEKNFLCGDSKVDAWKSVPLSQAQFHASTFLQSKGYFRPTFEEQGETLVIYAGEPTRITGFSATGAPASLEIHKRRKVKNQLLTPKFLGELRSWAGAKLRSQGYPCPEIRMEADANTGKVIAHITPGPRQVVSKVLAERVKGMSNSMLRRYDAFKVGELYNEDFFTLTADRTENSGLLQNTYFFPQCGQNSAHITQKTFAGKPRVVHFGFGVNTEGLVLGKGSWRHGRLGKRGSTFGISALASYKAQEFNIESQWYFTDKAPRLYFAPLFTFEHERESQYHLTSYNVRAALASSHDTQEVGFKFWVGPNLSYVDTYRGPQAGLTRFVSLQTAIEVMSHYFEYYQTNPRTGFQARFLMDLNHKNLLSDVTAQRFMIDGHYLYNLLDLDPPLLVLGFRGGLYQTLVNENDSNLNRLPPTYRFYLGGSADLRGYDRKEIPNEDGALSAVTGSIEARLANVLPWGIQPLVFLDAGVVGNGFFDFSYPIYFSPGGGIRYQSPFGMFKATVAHGLKVGGDAGPAPHVQFYFSFGEEF